MGRPRKLKGEDMTKKKLAEEVNGREEEAERELQEAMDVLNDAIEKGDE
jgi:hypothetical protein